MPLDAPGRYGSDAYAPAQIARLVEAAGVRKAGLPLLQTLTLATLAGAFIAFGAMFYLIIVTGSTLGWGPTRLLGGAGFSLGLILVVVAGAELFTGNNLIVMAWADGKVSSAKLLRNWGLVFFGNLLGSLGTLAIVLLANFTEAAGGELGATAARVASAKLELSFIEAFARGLLCNALVCLAVWLSFAGRSVVDKIFAILFPIAAFVALGFEHSIANMFLIPLGMAAGAGLDLGGFIANLVPVTLGNIVGGSVFVALIYWICYLREG